MRKMLMLRQLRNLLHWVQSAADSDGPLPVLIDGHQARNALERVLLSENDSRAAYDRELIALEIRSARPRAAQ
ncbi:hypothetical protein [Cryobacterium aureum]|uniref:hypothetical protein n=1 Tax=Cryobacterium aureum TaxID=995037 RepID=UPI0011E4D1D4|nr:hypothetical protein [Cryobacterium aureum]